MDEPHVRLSLGLYLLGALDAGERALVERHLAGCDACRAESDELATTVVAVALLPDEERRDIAEEFGLPRPSAPELATVPLLDPPSAGDPAGTTVPSGPVGPAASSAVLGRAPAATARGPAPPAPRPVRPGGPRPRRRARRMRSIGGLVIVVLVSAGIFIGLAVNEPPTGPRPRVTITLAATADTTTGATLSVVAVGHGSGVTVRATVSGLHAGNRYQLLAVTTTGVTHVVATWPGSNGPKEVTGETPVAVADLAFFTVARSDGTPVVSAAVPRPR